MRRNICRLLELCSKKSKLTKLLALNENMLINEVHLNMLKFSRSVTEFTLQTPFKNGRVANKRRFK